MLKRRLRKGQNYHQPYLGCREFPAQVSLFKGDINTLNLAYADEDSAKKAVQDADVILTTRMRLETQDKMNLPTLDEYKRFFRIDHKLLQYAKPDAIVMHPGPIQRGIEISGGVIDSPQCIINDQIANSVAVRMAMFYILSQMGGGLV